MMGTLRGFGTAVLRRAASVAVLCVALLVTGQPEAEAQPAGWSEAFSVSSAGTESLSPSVAPQGDGRISVVWSGFHEDRWALFSRVGSNDGALWNPISLLAEGDFDCLFPAAAVGTDLYLAWVESSGDQRGSVVFARSIDGGLEWEDPRVISDSKARTSSVCIAAVGSTVHVAWTEARTGTPNILYAVSPDGGESWSPNRQITSMSTYCWCPSIAASGSYVYLVWEDWRQGTPEVYFCRSVNQGENWEPQFSLSTANKFASERPRISTAGSYLHVAWQEESAEGYAVRYAWSSNQGSSWYKKALASGGGEVRLPLLAARGDRLLVDYQREISGSEEIYFMESTDRGTNWTPDAAFSPVDGSWSALPASALGESHAYLAWTDTASATPEVRISQRPPPPGAMVSGWVLY